MIRTVVVHLYPQSTSLNLDLTLMLYFSFKAEYSSVRCHMTVQLLSRFMLPHAGSKVVPRALLRLCALLGRTNSSKSPNIEIYKSQIISLFVIFIVFLPFVSFRALGRTYLTHALYIIAATFKAIMKKK